MTLTAQDSGPAQPPPRVSLEPTAHHNMTLDGSWWPRSETPEAELLTLVPALGRGKHGPVVRLLLSAAGWNHRPHHLTVGDRSVSVGYFAGRSPTMLTAICADGDTITLVVRRRP